LNGLVKRASQSSIFGEIVAPQHTLIYPYPARHLPKTGVLKPCLRKLHANRKDQTLAALPNPSNEPEPCILSIGDEQGMIEVIKS
jgi:hypothetical protein